MLLPLLQGIPNEKHMNIPTTLLIIILFYSVIIKWSFVKLLSCSIMFFTLSILSKVHETFCLMKLQLTLTIFCQNINVG